MKNKNWTATGVVKEQVLEEDNEENDNDSNKDEEIKEDMPTQIDSMKRKETMVNFSGMDERSHADKVKSAKQRKQMMKEIRNKKRVTPAGNQ